MAADALHHILQIFQGPAWYRRKIAEDATRIAAGAGDPLALAWRACEEPHDMLRLLEAGHRDRALAIRMVRESIVLTVDREAFAALDRVLAGVAPATPLWNLHTDFSRVAHDRRRQLAKAIRALWPLPWTLAELLDRELAAEAARRAALRRVGFADYFERTVQTPLPFAIPPDAVALDDAELDGTELADVLIGTPPAKERSILVQTQIGALDGLPVGYFMTGFWGHGVNSYAFYYCDVSHSRRVFLRIPFGGVYGDIVRERAAVRDTLARVARLEHDAAHGQWTLCDSMGAGWFAFTLDGGATQELTFEYGFDWDAVARLVEGSGG